MRITTDGVADENGIVAGFVEPSVGFKNHADPGQGAAGFQTERLVQRDRLSMTQRLRGANRVAAFKSVPGH